MSSIYRCYRPKKLINKPFKRSLRGSNYFTPAQRIILSTDKNGLVALRPLIGTTEGTIRIQAQALKLETGNVNTPADLTGNATYLIQAKASQDGPASPSTSFSGQIFDDKSRPLAGIKVSIGRTALVSTTDEAGKFELSNIPPGRIDLFIDGRTYNPTLDTTRAQYPSLHFEAYAVKGRINQIAHPIYLPPLATSADSAKQVGGNQDVILTIPGLAGFAMKVKANSVTFPDGSKTGLLIVSPVTADKLPMSPPAGSAQFGVPAWTLQPAGTRFDPPIEVTLPNTRAYPAGDNIPVVQWDHDLGQYVAMGRATVSEDGAVLITDSGSGLTKAGWGGACVYDPDKCAKEASKCEFCKSSQTLAGRDCPSCEWDSGQQGKEESKTDQVVVYEVKLGESKATTITLGILKKLGLVEAKWKIKGKFQHGTRLVCCADQKSTVKKVNLSGFADVEAEAEGDLLPLKGAAKNALLSVLKKLVPVTGQSDLDLGVFAKVKLALNANIPSVVRKGCDKQWEVTGGLTLSGTGEIEVRFSGETSLFQPDGKPIKAKVVPVAGGVTASGGAVVKSNGAAPPTWNGKATVYAFVKSEIEVWNFKETIIWFAQTYEPYIDGVIDYLPDN